MALSKSGGIFLPTMEITANSDGTFSKPSYDLWTFINGASGGQQNNWWNNAQKGGGITSDQVTQVANIFLGTAGLLLNTTQVITYNEISQTARKTGNIAEALLNKYSIDKTIGKISQKLGVVGAAVNGLNLMYKVGAGKEIKTRDLVDVGIGVGLSLLTISNPIGLIGLGVYGLMDAYGVFDGIKEEYLGQTVISGSKK